MTINEYQRLAMTTLNPALGKKDVLINGVMGLCGESGEVIDVVKKHLAQGHELDREKILAELGDVAWYLAEVAYALDTPLEDVLEGNIEKLRRRYPEGFDTEKSVNRQTVVFMLNGAGLLLLLLFVRRLVLQKVRILFL